MFKLVVLKIWGWIETLGNLHRRFLIFDLFKFVTEETEKICISSCQKPFYFTSIIFFSPYLFCSCVSLSVLEKEIWGVLLRVKKDIKVTYKSKFKPWINWNQSQNLKKKKRTWKDETHMLWFSSDFNITHLPLSTMGCWKQFSELFLLTHKMLTFKNQY